MEILKNTYIEHDKIPITATILNKDDKIPTPKVFKRVFGSWQNACKEANIPYGIKKINVLQGNYHRKIDRVGEKNSTNMGVL